MKNITKNMYGKMAAILLTVVLLTAGLSCTALAAGENILESISGFDPTFESYAEKNEKTGEVTYTKPAEASGSAVTIGEGNESATSLKLGTTGDIISIAAPVKPNKNYTFSFWMRNSLEGSLQLQRGAFYFINPDDNKEHQMVNRSEKFDWMLPDANGYIGTNGTSDTYYPTAVNTFGATRTDEIDQNTWRKVSINFTTPPEACHKVSLNLAAVKDDPKLAIDDLELIETNFEPNFFWNGNLEAIDYSASTPSFTGVNLSSGADQCSIEATEDGENHYYKVATTTELSTKRQTFNLEFLRMVFRGKNLGSRYKLSYRAKAIDNPGQSGGRKNTGIYLRGTNKGNVEVGLGTYADEWQTHTLYVDTTDVIKAGSYYTGYIQFVQYCDKEYTLYVDDIYLYYDQNNISFYKDLDFVNTETRNTILADGKLTANLYCKTETSREVEALSDSLLVKDAEGNRTVKVRAHYLPETIWGTDDSGATTATFNETKISLLSAVYAYEKDKTGNIIENTKKLVTVGVESGTSSVNGETIDIVDEITVPQDTDDVKYQVEAVALNLSTLKPIAEKAILN